jgi:aminopeptidase N
MLDDRTQNVKLPDHIIPHHYKILLTPDLDNFTFVGEEVITIELKKPSDSIMLHSAELEILSVEVVFKNKKNIGKVVYDDKNETATFRFQNTIPAGEAKLKIEFTGILNDKLKGFYRSSYEVDGRENHMGVTQFESTDARRAIPCFDD